MPLLVRLGVMLVSNSVHMISRLHLSTIIFFATVVWAVLLILNGQSISPQWFHPFSTVVGVLIIGLNIFDRWAWRFPLLHPWFVSQPNLRGTWKTVLHSTWVDPETNQRPDPIEAYVVIRQTFSSLYMRLITRESSSESLAAALVRANDGVWSIVTVYRNTPRAMVLHRSRQHFGGCILNVNGHPPDGLEGQYWTDRDTRGEMQLTARNKRIFDNFTTASQANYTAISRL